MKMTLDSNKMGIWFTSDTHFYHKNIIKFSNRPWNTVEEMNTALINNWNEVVKPNDIVFHLGDFAFASNGKWKELINKLNGNIYLIFGNHDESRNPGKYVLSLFKGVYNQLLIKIDDRKVYLNHYPFLCYAGTYIGKDYNTIQLFGHVHSNKENTPGKDKDRLKYLFPTQYDVGVDNNNYYPVSWKQVQEIINKQLECSTEAQNRVHAISDTTYKE